MRSLNLILVFLLSCTVLAKAQSSSDTGSFTQDPQAKVQLFPNPTPEFLHVKLDGVQVANLQIAVRNIIGNEMPLEIEYVSSDELRLRVKDYTTGYYLLALRDESVGFKGTYKFLKR